MIPITFKGTTHEGDGRYAIDWDTAEERKYKQVARGIIVYENDSVVISSNGSRDPAWRNYMRYRYGLDFRLFSELTGFSFYVPTKEGDVKVHKKNVDNDVYLYTSTWGRIYPVKWRTPLTIYSPTAMPSTMGKISAYVPNKEKEKEFKAQLTEHYKLGETLFALHGWGGREWFHVSPATANILLTGGPVPTDLSQPEAQNFCLALVKCRSYCNEMIARAMRAEHKTPYLIAKEEK